MTDYELVWKYKKENDKDALWKLYNRYKGMIHYFKNRFQGRYEDREDFPQDGYIEFHKIVNNIDFDKIKSKDKFSLKFILWRKLITLKKVYYSNRITDSLNGFKLVWIHHPNKQSHKRTHKIIKDDYNNESYLIISNYAEYVEAFSNKRFWINDYSKLEKLLLDYINNLPEKEKQLFELLCMGLKYRDISAIINRSAGWMGKKKKKRKAELKDILNENLLLNM